MPRTISSCSPCLFTYLKLTGSAVRLFSLTDFRGSPYEAFEEDQHRPSEMAKSKDGTTVKEERYSPWGAEQDTQLGLRTESPVGNDARDVYGTEQLVPAAASYQPYRYAPHHKPNRFNARA